MQIKEIKYFHEAAKLAPDAGWCIADRRDEFNEYIQKGKIWFVIAKSGKKNRPVLCVHKDDDGEVEMAFRGNKECDYYEAITRYKFVKPFLKEIGASTPLPRWREAVKTNNLTITSSGFDTSSGYWLCYTVQEESNGTIRLRVDGQDSTEN
jgi:hypothetical protein